MPVRTQGEARQPDRDAVEALARKHGPALIRYFEKRGVSPAEAEDAAQEVLARLARREGVAEIERLEGYLFQTAAHVAVDLHRQGRARHVDRHDPYEETIHARADVSPADVLEGRETLGQVITALLELPERTRHVFVLTRFERMRQGEVARRLGMSVSAVEKHLKRAMIHLMDRVERGA